MRPRLLASLLVVPVLALAACGGNGNDVNTASYTCAEFSKSLKTKGDDSAGNFINQLRKEAKLGQSQKTERGEISLGIFLACRGKAGSTRPAKDAIAVAKGIKAGTFKLPATKKKSND